MTEITKRQRAVIEKVVSDGEKLKERAHDEDNMKRWAERKKFYHTPEPVNIARPKRLGEVEVPRDIGLFIFLLVALGWTAGALFGILVGVSG